MFDVNEIQETGSLVERWNTPSGNTYAAYAFDGKEAVVHEEDNELVSVFSTGRHVKFIHYVHPRDAERFVALNARLFGLGVYRYVGTDENMVEILDSLGVFRRG